MKKFMSLLLVFIMCLCTVRVFADDVKYASRSGYEVYIDYTPIDFYIINDLTYIEVEDLVNYGFTVDFDETAQSYNVFRIKFATPMYTREMWKKQTSAELKMVVEDSNIKVYLDGELVNSYFAGGKTLIPMDALGKYGEVSSRNVLIFREEMKRELDNAENIVEISYGQGTYKGQVDENNKPHGIGWWVSESGNMNEFEYLGYFTHSKPDGLIYKKERPAVDFSFMAKDIIFMGKVDGTKTAENTRGNSEAYSYAMSSQDLPSGDKNFGSFYLPVMVVYGSYEDNTVYTQGLYYEGWAGMYGRHDYKIWYDGKEKQVALDYSYGEGQGMEAIDYVRRTAGIDASYLSTFYEYTNGVLDMHTGFINTATENGVNNPVDGAGTFITVLLNDKDIVFDVLLVKQNDRVLVPVRAIAEALGAKVSWDNDTWTADIVKDGKTVTLQIGNNVMKIDDREITLDVAPKIIDGSTMVPVRAVSEAFEAKVDWNNELQQVIIKTN